MCAFIPALDHLSLKISQSWPDRRPPHPPFLFTSGVAALPQLPPLRYPRIPLTWPLITGGFPALRRFQWKFEDSMTYRRPIRPCGTQRQRGWERKKEREREAESEKRTKPSRRTFWINEREKKGVRQMKLISCSVSYRSSYICLIIKRGKTDCFFFLFTSFLFLLTSLSILFFVNALSPLSIF